MITAHSGCEETERDSLESIDKAVEFNADAVEVDVRMDKYGILRISHDFTDNQTKPTLFDVFEKIKDTDLMINCDLKEPCVLFDTIKLAKRFGIKKDRLILSGCTTTEDIFRTPWICDNAMVFLNICHILHNIYATKKMSAEYHKAMVTGTWKYLYSQLGRDFLIPEEIKTTADYVKETNAFAINVPYKLCTDDFIDAMKEENIPVSVWTVNDKEDVKKFIEKGVLNVTTLNPSLR